MDDDRVVEFDDGDDDLPFALNERVDEEETHPRPAPPSASSSHHDHDSASSSAFRSFGSSSVTPERKKTARLRTGTAESEVTAPITPASASASASLLYQSQGPPSSSASSYGVAAAAAAAAAGGLHLAPFDGSAATTPSQSSVPSAHHQTSSSSTYNPVNDQRYLSPSHRCSIHLDESGGGGPLSPSAAEAAACAAATLMPSHSVSMPLGPLAVSLAATSVSTADFQQDASSSHYGFSPPFHPAPSTDEHSKLAEEGQLAIVEEGQTIVEEGQAAIFEEEEEVATTEDEEAVQCVENGEGDGGGGMIICGPSSQSFATAGRATGRAPVSDDRRDMHRIAEAARRRMLSSGLRHDRGAASGISVVGMETVLMQSTQPQQQQQRHHPSNLMHAAGEHGRPAIDESVGFSQLMRRAEEGGGGSVAANQSSWVLHAPSSSFPEGTTTSTTREGTISPSAGDRFRLLPRGGAARSGSVGFPLSPPPPTTASTNAADAAAASSSLQGTQVVPQHLASQPPASVVERLDSVCFRVRTSIALPAASKADIVDLLSDPESLGRWFGPVLGRAVYVTRSDHRGGGGASSATSSASASSPSGASHESERSTGNRDREYDGEWIEASAAGGLRPPSSLDNNSADFGDGCAHRAWTRTKSFLGFPTYGKLSMFVERNAGRVGMTVGPYDNAGTVVSHSFEVTLEEEEGEGAASSPSVTVTDTVRMDRSPDYDAGGGYSWTCNLCKGPGPAEHAAQAAVSLDRLRRLIEGGGGGGGGGGAGSDFSLAHGDPSSLAATIIPESGDGGDWDGAARVPLLPGP